MVSTSTQLTNYAKVMETELNNRSQIMTLTALSYHANHTNTCEHQDINMIVVSIAAVTKQRDFGVCVCVLRRDAL